MLTIFTTPRPFFPPFDVIQWNAIKSWTLLSPKCEIILFGDEEGTSETATELGVLYVPEIKTTEFGTPLVDDVFEKAQKMAKNKILAYVNADIILMQDLIKALETVKKEVKDKNFLMVGRRQDLDVKGEIDFNDPGWENKMRIKAKKEGKLHSPDGIDYFVFSKAEAWNTLPPLANGRGVFDNMMLQRARILKMPLIDASKTVTAIHQDHPYSYAGIKAAKEQIRKERNANLELAGKTYCAFIITDADCVLEDSGLKKAHLTLHRFYRCYETLPVLRPNLGILIKVVLLPVKLPIMIIRRIQRFLKLQRKKFLKD